MPSSSLLFDSAFRGDASVQGIEETPSGDPGRGSWPRLINLDEDVKTLFTSWLNSEIESFNLERGDLLEDWITWQKLYWAAPAKKEKTFPFKRSANIVVPLAAIAVEAIHARIMNTLFSVQPFWSIRPRSKEWILAAKPFESYLQAEVENGETLKVFEFCNETTLELVKLGTCIGKSGYERLTLKSLRSVGDTEEEVFVTIRNGANIGRVPLGNFIMRFAELDPQTAPLVGEKHEFSWGELKRFAQDGRMDPKVVENIKNRWIQKNQSAEPNDGGQLAGQVEKEAKTEPIWSEVLEVYELWCSFDIDGDGWNEEIVVDYFKDSGEFLSIRYNWNDDLHRPYRIANFLNVEGIWPGIGVCTQTEQFQVEATTIHRQRLDNATLANMTQLAIRKGLGYGPGEPIFPGKMWFLDDPQRDIREFKLSEIYPSSYANEDAIIRYWEKRTGANEVVLGIPQEGTPGTATSDLTRLAEGNKRFDLAMKNIKRWLSLIGVDVVTNMQQFGNQQAHWWILGEDGKFVEQVLDMPSVLVRKGALIDLSVTDSLTNLQVEQTTWMQLFQVVTGYYDRVLQLAQLLGPEVFGQIAQKALISGDEVLKRLLETFNVPDTGRFALTEEGQNGQPTGTPAGPGANQLTGASNPNGPGGPSGT